MIGDSADSGLAREAAADLGDRGEVVEVRQAVVGPELEVTLDRCEAGEFRERSERGVVLEHE